MSEEKAEHLLCVCYALRFIKFNRGILLNMSLRLKLTEFKIIFAVKLKYLLARKSYSD